MAFTYKIVFTLNIKKENSVNFIQNYHYFYLQVKDMDIEWPLGFMLNKTTSFPSAHTDRPLTATMFSLLLFLFSAFLFSGILFLRHSIKIRKHSASYQRCDSHQAQMHLYYFMCHATSCQFYPLLYVAGGSLCSVFHFPKMHVYSTLNSVTYPCNQIA